MGGLLSAVYQTPGRRSIVESIAQSSPVPAGVAASSVSPLLPSCRQYLLHDEYRALERARAE